MLEINASIAGHGKKTWCTYRTEHLFNFDAGTRLVELGDDFEPVSEVRLIAENGNTAFEDVRLFSSGQELHAIYTYLPKDNEGGWKWEYGVGIGNVDVESGKIVDQISLRHLSKRKHEKNWCPYLIDGEIFMLTDCDPYVRVISIGKVGGPRNPREIYFARQKTIGWDFGELRGGTPLLSAPGEEDGWRYGFAHSFLPSHERFARYYFFTAVRFNHYSRELQYYPIPLECDFETEDRNYDELWAYSNNRILKVVFPIGIMQHEEGVMVSFGIDDVTSVSNYYSWESLKNFFKLTVTG